MTPEKKNYQIRVGNLKVVAWDNIDKNGNPYLSYSISRSEKDQYGQWTDKSINVFANDLIVIHAIIGRILDTITLRPISLKPKESAGSAPPQEEVQVGTIGDDIQF